MFEIMDVRDGKQTSRISLWTLNETHTPPKEDVDRQAPRRTHLSKQHRKLYRPLLADGHVDDHTEGVSWLDLKVTLSEWTPMS
ncbi:hypothetical protein LTR86_011095 [Recurvomyces mirabilis]|nr:hypothetical protein LTR86_011095 [Recurvomyces mirabilis]